MDLMSLVARGLREDGSGESVVAVRLGSSVHLDFDQLPV